MTDAELLPIRDIQPDIHRVWARDEVSGETDWKNVLAHYANHYDETLTLTVFDPDSGEEQVITSNRIHPFFARPAADLMPVLSVRYDPNENENGEWIEAQDLTKGQRLYSEDGTWDIVSDLKIETIPLKAFNLTVDDFHTYFIAQSDNDTPLWVHNDCLTKEVKEKWPELVGVLRDATKQKGNFGIGSSTNEKSEILGNAWVGANYKVASDGKTLISNNGLRQYRPPSKKPNSPYSKTGIQANFERREHPNGPWIHNGHLDIEE